MSLRNMEKSHLYKSMELQKNAMGLYFSGSKRTKKKHLAHPRGSFFLACKLTLQLGTALVRCAFKTVVQQTHTVYIKHENFFFFFPETESENEFRPLDERIDEFHPKATRTLFIGNLEKTTTYHDLLNIFQRFGEIVVG